LYVAPKPSEMFSDASTGTAVAERFEAYKAAMRDSHARSDQGDLRFVPEQGIVKVGQATQAAARLDTITKGLSADAAASMQGDLDALKTMLADLSKDWTTTNPNNSPGLVPYDLEAPAKLIVPRVTPLRNSLPRNNSGKGNAREFRRITGWTNSGTGGIADAMAFFNSESVSNTFGGVTGLRRPNKITYASDTKTASYVEQGLSDSVTFKAQFAGQGFDDIRQLSQTALLWASMGAEERALLFGRGASGKGYAGAVAAPTISAVGANTGGAITNGTYRVIVTARAGGGESVVSNEVTATTTGTGTITVTVTSEPTGALGYNLYVSQAGGGASSETFQTSFVGNTFVLTTQPTNTGAAIPGADSTSNANGYDGFLTVLADPTQSGYVKRVNASVTSDDPWQQAFMTLYGAAIQPGGGANGDKRLADPDEIWVDGGIRKKLGDFLKGTATSSNYRIAFDIGPSGHAIGEVVNGIANQVTGKMVDLDVHPYMPLGASMIRSRTLPIPNTEIGATSEVVNVVDYLSYSWPEIQMTYDQSTYWFGTLVHYAPAWSGLLLGLQ
jgi:hypothetical protein